jgi:hypothetical protein
MLRNDNFSIGLVTFYLLIYYEMMLFEATTGYAMVMLLLSPLLLCWMVFTVLKYGKDKSIELGDDEFGYQDKRKEELGVF